MRDNRRRSRRSPAVSPIPPPRCAPTTCRTSAVRRSPPPLSASRPRRRAGASRSCAARRARPGIRRKSARARPPTRARRPRCGHWRARAGAPTLRRVCRECGGSCVFSIHARERGQYLSQCLARTEQTRLHGVHGAIEDRGHFLAGVAERVGELERHALLDRQALETEREPLLIRFVLLRRFDADGILVELVV